MIPIVIKYTKSAFKHGCTKADITQAIMMPLYNDILDEYQGKYLLLGFNSNMNVPECFFTLAGFLGGKMPDMTEEAYDALDELLTKTTGQNLKPPTKRPRKSSANWYGKK